MYEMIRNFAGPVATVIAAFTAAGVAIVFGLTQFRIARVQSEISAAMLRAAQQRNVMDLFDKRWLVASELTSAIGEIARTGRVSPRFYGPFLVASHRAKFLFGPDVTSYLETVRKAMNNHQAAQEALESASDHQMRIKALDDEAVAFQTITDFYKQFNALAQPYMDMHQKLPG